MSRSTRRLITLLELLDRDPAGFRLTEFAEKLEAPKSSLIPVLRELEAAGFVMRTAENRYSAGAALKHMRPAAPRLDGSPAAAFGALIEHIRRDLQAHGVSILLWDANDGLLRPVYSYSVIGHESVTVRPGEGVAGQVWVTKRSVLVPDYMLWEHAVPRFRSQMWRSHIGVPLITRGNLIGVVVVRSHNESLTFSQADVSRVEQIAAEAATAIK